MKCLLLFLFPVLCVCVYGDGRVGLSPVIGVPHTFAQYIIDKFNSDENERMAEALSRTGSKAIDRWTASSSPFITGNGFRQLCFPHVIDKAGGRCNVSTAIMQAVPSGKCLYITSDCMGKVINEFLPTVRNKITLVVHNGDQSVPDGQTDKQLGLQTWKTLPTLQAAQENGNILAVHAQNLWWTDWRTIPRPSWLHCLPIGLENRGWSKGGNLVKYINMIREVVLGRPADYHLHSRPLLLVAFSPKRISPDRKTALDALALNAAGTSVPFYNRTALPHDHWLQAIGLHRFTLCPFGHGLDTHRLWEVLLMGGVPVVRRSSITSCLDDSDNQLGDVIRGSLPIVVVDSWSDVTKEFLETKWVELSSPREPGREWDYSRIILSHWEKRILSGHRRV